MKNQATIRAEIEQAYLSCYYADGNEVSTRRLMDRLAAVEAVLTEVLEDYHAARIEPFSAERARGILNAPRT